MFNIISIMSQKELRQKIAILKGITCFCFPRLFTSYLILFSAINVFNLILYTIHTEASCQGYMARVYVYTRVY